MLKHQCHLIYAGGTFGSHGAPLSTLDATAFLKAFLWHYPTIKPLNNPLIKDSSNFTPADFLAFYQLIVDAHQKGAQCFIMISGTDTLAYLSAFLAYALAGLPLSVVIVASMHPFFDPTHLPLTPDPRSDASSNFNQALDFFCHPKAGVYVCVDGKRYHGQGLQKIHSHQTPAFAGCDDTTPLVIPQLASYTPKGETPVIHSIYCLPNDPQALTNQLEPLIGKPPSAVIILGFGAGNMPYSQPLYELLVQLKARGFLLVMTSACPFGGASQAYEAGAWVYEAGVLSGEQHTIATLYAKCLWLCMTNPLSRRPIKWESL